MKFINILDRIATRFSHYLNWIAGGGLVAMLVVFVADIIGVKLFNRPFPGAIEWIGFLSVISISFALAYTEVQHGNIQVDFFIDHLPRRLRAALYAFVCFLGTGLFVVLCWQCWLFGRTLQSTNSLSMTQNIPLYPFVYAIAFCCIPLCLVLLAKCLKSIVEGARK